MLRLTPPPPPPPYTHPGTHKITPNTINQPPVLPHLQPNPLTHPPPSRYDALSNYDNERSPWLAALLQRVERPWQAWEAAQLAAWRGEGLEGYQALGAEEVKGALRDR